MRCADQPLNRAMVEFALIAMQSATRSPHPNENNAHENNDVIASICFAAAAAD
jgi:hypothetical protein